MSQRWIGWKAQPLLRIRYGSEDGCLSKALLSDWKRRSHALVELFPSGLFGYPFLGNGKEVFFVSQKVVSC